MPKAAWQNQKRDEGGVARDGCEGSLGIFLMNRGRVEYLMEDKLCQSPKNEQVYEQGLGLGNPKL